MKILILASNPRKDLNLDREIRDLKRAIENSRNREEFEVVDELAVRVGDLQELLHKHRPQIVHFCGHGSGKQGLVFESDMGREHWVSTDALSNLFRLFSSRVECVLLNACYSEEQAGAIVDHINYVIGMNQEIRDDAAIAFSKGFYRALGYACSIEQSYEFGCNAIQLEISGSSVVRSAVSETERKLGVVDAVAKIAIPEHQKPILKKKPTLTSNLSASIPSPNQTLSQEKRTEIQLDIDTSLKADSKVKQYRDRVQEFLGDRKLTEFEKIRLDQLQKSLGLSDEEARQILAEEQALLQEARDEYKEMVIQLIEKGQYPFNVQTEQELGQLRQELQLTDEEVNEISRPIIEKAEAEYQAVLAQQKYNLGNTLHNQGKLEEAIAAYRKAIEIDPNYAMAYNFLGSTLQSQGKLEEAITAYRKAIEIDPKLANAYHNLANAYYNLGIILNNQGKLEEAIAASRKAIEIEPNFAMAYYNLGNTLHNQGKLEEAIAASRKAIKIEPNFAVGYNSLGNTLKNQGKLEEAIAAYRKAIEINPNYAMAYYNLGIILNNQRKLEEAIAAYRKAIEINPNYAMAYCYLGNTLKNQGKLEEAIPAYRKAIEINPNYASAYCNLGNTITLLNQGKLEEAITAYRKAIEIDPNYAMAYYFLGITLKSQGKLEEAITAYRKAIEIDPNYAMAYNSLGFILQNQGKLEEAIAAFRKAIEIDPNLAIAHSNLEKVLKQSKKFLGFF
jgi:tetratricopeptide (TPR) repeat protein